MPGDACVFIAIGHFREGVVEDQQAFIRFNDVDGRLDQYPQAAGDPVLPRQEAGDWVIAERIVKQPEQAGHSMPVLSGRA